MKFALESYSSELVAEMIPLWKAHYQEIAAFQDIPLDPDLAVYERINAGGGLRIYTAREGLALIGYQVVFVARNPHYKTSIQANQDILFIDKFHRRGMTGYKFIAWCDAQLKSEGVQAMYQHVKAAHDFTKMLTRMGYVLHDRVMVRRLD